MTAGQCPSLVETLSFFYPRTHSVNKVSGEWHARKNQCCLFSCWHNFCHLLQGRSKSELDLALCFSSGDVPVLQPEAGDGVVLVLEVLKALQAANCVQSCVALMPTKQETQLENRVPNRQESVLTVDI